MSSTASAFFNWLSPRQQAATSNTFNIPDVAFNPNDSDHQALVAKISQEFEQALQKYKPLLMKVGLGSLATLLCWTLDSLPFSTSLGIGAAFFTGINLTEFTQAYQAYTTALAKVSDTVSWCMQSKVANEHFNSNDFYYALRSEPVQQLIIASGRYLNPEHLNKLENRHLQSGMLQGSNIEREKIGRELFYIRDGLYQGTVGHLFVGESFNKAKIGELIYSVKNYAVEKGTALISMSIKRD